MRVIAHRKMLHHNDIFRIIDALNNPSAVQLASRIAGLEVIHHKCDGGLICPLKIGLSRLHDGVRGIMEEATSLDEFDT